MNFAREKALQLVRISFKKTLELASPVVVLHRS